MALMNRSSSASRRRLERGQFSWVTFVLLSALVAGVYLGVVWAPVYIVHREVQGVVREYVAKAIHEHDDDLLVADLCRKLASLDESDALDAQGQPVKVPTVDVSPGDVTWERDTTVKPPMLHVAFTYVRVVKYPFLDRTQEKVMSVDVTEDIGVPKW